MAINDYATALVTGASSGIGEAIVHALAKHDLTIHAMARRKERLTALAEATGCLTHAADVRDRDAMMRLAATIEPDILVVNAGLGRAQDLFWQADPDEIAGVIETNVMGAFNTVRAFLPGMVARRRGHVVTMGSMAGLYPSRPTAYGATKGAINFMSKNLRLDLQGTRVRVTEICPGRVESEFHDMAFGDPSRAAAAKDTGTEPITSADVAEAVMYAVTAPWRVNVNRIELQPTEQTYGGVDFVPARR